MASNLYLQILIFVGQICQRLQLNEQMKNTLFFLNTDVVRFNVVECHKIIC